VQAVEEHATRLPDVGQVGADLRPKQGHRWWWWWWWWW